MIAERARKALDKPSKYGPDIDLKSLEIPKGAIDIRSREEVAEEYSREAEKVGVDLRRRGGYVQVDERVVFKLTRDWMKKHGVLLMSMREAIEELSWAKDYYWKAVPVDADKYTATVELAEAQGYFIYVPPGIRVKAPVQTCLLLYRSGIAQPVHNIVVVEEGSELHLLTGCASAAHEGAHLSVSEFYVKRNAKLTFTMIHSWSTGLDVRPRTGVVIEEGGEYISTYLTLAPVRSLQSYPIAYLKADAKCRMNTIIVAKERSIMDLGGKLVFRGEGAGGEVVSRAVARDEAKVYARGALVGEKPGVRGHLECSGLILSTKARILAAPELDGRVAGVELTHEAAVGKIAEEQITYLMARGFTREEATSIIVRGFMEVNLEGIPPELATEVKKVLDATARGL